MNTSLKVSVVVPVYNAETYLSDCINSILEQDYENIEVILVNDGSSDASASICKQYQTNDNRVRYFEQTNAGVSAARNTGLAKAEGEYILFVDSDDAILPSCIDRMVKTAMMYNADLVIGSYEIKFINYIIPIFIQAEQIIEKKYLADYFSEHFLEAIASSVWGKLYKKDLIHKNFQKHITMGEDLLFNLEYIKNIHSLATVSNAVYSYNQTNTNSLVSNYKQIYFEQDKYVCTQWIQWLEKCEALKYIENVYYRIGSSFWDYLLFVVEHSRRKQAKENIYNAVDVRLEIAIKKSWKKYAFYQKILLKNVFKRKINTLYIMSKVYVIAKNFRKKAER